MAGAILARTGSTSEEAHEEEDGRMTISTPTLIVHWRADRCGLNRIDEFTTVEAALNAYPEAVPAASVYDGYYADTDNFTVFFTFPVTDRGRI